MQLYEFICMSIYVLTVNFSLSHSLSLSCSVCLRQSYEFCSSVHLSVLLILLSLCPRDRGFAASCFCSGCHSVILSETSTFVWYITWVFLVTTDKTFPWVPTYLILWPWPWSLPLFLKILTCKWLLNTSARNFIVDIRVSSDNCFLGIPACFDTVAFISEFGLHFEIILIILIKWNNFNKDC